MNKIIHIVLLTFLFTQHVESHGSLIMPPTRNAIDSELPAWSKGKHPNTGWIEPYNCRCVNGTDAECNSGQSCFWFSQGCTIGCSKCDGNGTRLPNFDHCPNESIKPTINDPKYRTINQEVEAGTVEDFTKFNPWRAPGRAPVYDACGMAGGVNHEVFNAGAYNTTKYAKQGDLGSMVLPRRPSGTVWKRGSIAMTRWENTAEHGGGYQYRLCPANEKLTEECFQKMPLTFATPNKHMIRFNDTSKDLEIKATVVPHSITGTGEWMLNPLPYGNENCTLCCDYIVQPPAHCEYKCPGCGAPWYSADGACPTDCSKSYPGLPHGGCNSKYLDYAWINGTDTHTFAIEDKVNVPKDIPAGEYVLGWRWDAEATSQIWSTCADITIV